MGNNIPPGAVAIDSWRTREVANNATTISTIAPTRSDHGARLKNTHHTTIANAATSPPSNPTGGAPGATSGTATSLNSSSSAAATTPGHSRSGFGEGSSFA